MKQPWLCFIFILFFISTKAQNKYWITFLDKANVTFDPSSYFEPRTLLQRRANNIPVLDSTDFPVSPSYLSQISRIVDSVSWPSRWLNGVAVYADAIALQKITALYFVKDITPMTAYSTTASFINETQQAITKENTELLKFQTQRMQADTFVAHKLDGKGIRIAVFDIGFPNVDDHPAFSHLRSGGRIIDTYDFVKRQKNVYRGHWHGTATLSCIAGKIDSMNIGLAPGAEFLLAKTERLLIEPFSEEENWLAAAEWADQHGANIISSSLGYTFHRYFNNQMDGHTSLVSRAATIAASKGILVVNAAGNEGADSWRFIDAPGDADSVLTVGGVDPYSDMHIYFSSFGPSSDGRLKPNVCALGMALVATPGGYKAEYGTSFSAPLVAGFAACAWQSHRSWTNMELFDAIEKSAHLYPYFDYAHGFGIPQAKCFTSKQELPEPTFDFVIINNDIKIILREKYSYPETEAALGYLVIRNFYYKIENKEGAIKKYSVLIGGQKEMLHFFAEEFQGGDVLTVHFEGHTAKIDFPEEVK